MTAIDADCCENDQCLVQKEMYVSIMGFYGHFMCGVPFKLTEGLVPVSRNRIAAANNNAVCCLIICRLQVPANPAE